MQDNPLPWLEKNFGFMGAHSDYKACSKVILGLPMDSTTSFRPGTRLAPARIRGVSEGIEEFSIYQKRSLLDINFYDGGDIVVPFGNVVESLNRIEQTVESILKQDKQTVCIGGEHLVSLPVIKAYRRRYPDLVVVQMDAHADLRKDYLGEELSHATVMRHVVEVIGPRRLYQLGIRSATEDELLFAESNTRLYLDQLSDAVDDVKQQAGSRPVYVTLDIDVLDPAFAPGTGTPEPGGFSSRELLRVLHSLAELDVVGFDLVEVAPPYEKGDNTSILGAKIIREALLAF
jgi:agmatinase